MYQPTPPKIMDKMSNKPFIVKCTGGTTAQLLALTNAIYVANRIKRPFKIKYYPTSTGTYWEFGIGDLLAPNEILEVTSVREIGMDHINSGTYIQDYPRSRNQKFYDGLQKLTHKFRINSKMRRLRGEFVIGGEREKLDSVTRKAKSISANFVPIVDEFVYEEMYWRFEKAGITNPFKTELKKNEVVIHYRLGDMRKLPQRVEGMGGHGVVSPETFREILKLEKLDNENSQVSLVSDEPEIARKVLLEAGIECKLANLNPTIWDDLRSIANANIFIGSLSQFSFFGGSICSSNGGRVYVPSTEYGIKSLAHSINNQKFNYFDYKYLPPSHWIFKD